MGRGARNGGRAPRSVERQETSAAGVETSPACTVGRNLQQAAGNREILEEMDQLILVGEIRVEGQRRRDREQRQRDRRDARPISQEHRETASRLQRNGAGIGQGRKRQADRADVADRPGRVGSLAHAEEMKMAASSTRPTAATRSLEVRRFECSLASANVGLIMTMSPVSGWMAPAPLRAGSRAGGRPAFRGPDASGGEPLDFDERALQRGVALLGADGEAIGVDELRLDTDEVEHALR